MLARIALAVARGMSTETLRSLVDVVFVRTRRDLAKACADPKSAQEARLRSILSTNASTEFGRAHDFASLAASPNVLEAYRAKVALRTWDDVEPLVTRMLAGERDLIVSEEPYFYATTSGTTGRRKLIPVTSSFVDECRVGNKVMFRSTLSSMPALLHGKRLNTRSPKTERLSDKAVAGSITVALGGGFEDEENALDAVPVEVFFVEDFATRYFLALRFALQERVTVCSAVNPSTLLLFARTLAGRGEELALALENGVLGVSDDKLAGLDDARRARLVRLARRDDEAAARVRKSASEHAGRARMKDVFPSLAGLACWKAGSAPWYLSRLKESYGDVPVLDYGYCASEGIFGAPVSTDGAASVLLPHGHVIELQPVDGAPLEAGETVWLHEAEIGKRYFVIVTTGAGLYRYQMNDVVEVTGKLDRAPLVVFLHKGGAMSSLTGEKLGESHVVNAMAKAAARTGVVANGFVASPLLPERDEAPRYLLALDLDDNDIDAGALTAIAAAFDAALREVNEEYDGKRKSLRLEAAVAAVLPKDAMLRFRTKRVAAGAPDAHVKIPHVSPDGALLVELGLDDTAPKLAARLPCRAAGAVAASGAHEPGAGAVASSGAVPQPGALTPASAPPGASTPGASTPGTSAASGTTLGPGGSRPPGPGTAGGAS